MKSTKGGRKIPRFKSDREAAEFWESHALTDYLDELEPVSEKIFWRPKKQVISIRLEREYIESLRAIARRLGIGPTTLVRMWIVEKLRTGASKAK